jgi:DNA-binding response OmpR family regulator
MALILLVDDERDACSMVQRILSTLGHEVRGFTDAKEAIQWLLTNTPDLALLDIRLRGMSGFVVLEYLRRKCPRTKTIMITGYPSAETAGIAQEMGVDDYLIKPMEIEELEKHVIKTLELVP